MFLVNYKGQTALAVNDRPKHSYLNNSEELLAITVTKVFNCQYQPFINLHRKYLQRKRLEKNREVELLHKLVVLEGFSRSEGPLGHLRVIFFSSNYFNRNKQTTVHISVAQLCSTTACAKNLYLDSFGE